MADLIWQGKRRIEAQQTSIRPQLQTQEILTNPFYEGNAAFSHPSWYNRLIHGDKAVTLPALLDEFAASINLIYIDPPFMTGRDFTSGAQLAYSDKWNNDLNVYLQWLYETFVLLHHLLAPTGSLYVHLDWRVIHYAKVLLDEIFGFSPNADGPGFKNEIIWHYQSGGRAYKWYARKHDTILLYTKSGQYCFHSERIGERRGSTSRNHMRKQIAPDGRISWTIRSSGRLYTYDEDTLIIPTDVWSDVSHLHQKNPERNGYATQKPAALLERILLASSEERDLVLDCFCGSGVTPAVAEQLQRRWIACDQSPLALQLTRERIMARESFCPFVVQQAVL